MPIMLFQNFEAAVRKPNLKPFALMDQRQDLTWIASNYSDFQTQNLTAVLPGGLGGVYQLDSAPANGAMIFRNGLAQFEGVAFTRNGATITFIYPFLPQPTDFLKAMTW